VSLNIRRFKLCFDSFGTQRISLHFARCSRIMSLYDVFSIIMEGNGDPDDGKGDNVAKFKQSTSIGAKSLSSKFFFLKITIEIIFINSLVECKYYVYDF